MDSLLAWAVSTPFPLGAGLELVNSFEMSRKLSGLCSCFALSRTSRAQRVQTMLQDRRNVARLHQAPAKSRSRPDLEQLQAGAAGQGLHIPTWSVSGSQSKSNALAQTLTCISFLVHGAKVEPRRAFPKAFAAAVVCWTSRSRKTFNDV